MLWLSTDIKFSQNNNHQATVTQFPSTQPMVLLPGDVKFVPTGHKKDFRSRRPDLKISDIKNIKRNQEQFCS